VISKSVPVIVNIWERRKGWLENKIVLDFEDEIVNLLP
jgi:hypothetical protein